MARIKRSDMRVIDDAFNMHGGYVLDFTDRTFAEFFEDELGIQIYNNKYSFNGSSKAKHLRAFVEVEDPYLVACTLRALWKYRESLDKYTDPTRIIQARLFELLGRLEAGIAVPPPDARPQRAWTAEEQDRRHQWVVHLHQFSEDEITEKILLPLFRQLGFIRITPSGHQDKNLEFGKDVWMKYKLPTNHFIYFGLQVKKAKLDAAGKSKNANIAEVHAQVLMMLGHPIFDPETNKEHLVDHGIIVSAGEITKQARNWLGQRLDASQRSQILFMDRQDILDLLVMHMTPFPDRGHPTETQARPTNADFPF